MARHTYLQKRKESGIYYCRVAIPKNLRSIIGKREFHVSLKTSDRIIARERVKAEAIKIDRILAQASGRDYQTTSIIMPATLLAWSAHSSVAIQSISFSELIERFMALPEKAKLTDKGKLEYRATFRLLGELFGVNKPIQTITRDDCRRVQLVFATLPANSTKRFPKCNVKRVLELSQAQNLKPMAVKTANSYLTRLSTLFLWAHREGLISNNPAQRLLLPETQAAKDKRHPFTTKQLEAIFNANVMQQYRNEHSAAFWVPMLSLWTGARLNELCQLHTADIQTREGIACMVIVAGDGKQLKTNSSQRVIPLHPKLIELGFLTYAQQVREAGHKNLFFDLRLDTKGSRSGYFSKDFARHLKSIGIKTNKNCFHSFRHNFRDAVREAGIEREVVQALGGWKDKSGGVEDNYGSGHSVQRLPPTRAFPIERRPASLHRQPW